MDRDTRAHERDAPKYAFYLYSLSLSLSAQVVACLDRTEDFRAKLSGRTGSVKVF